LLIIVCFFFNCRVGPPSTCHIFFLTDYLLLPGEGNFFNFHSFLNLQNSAITELSIKSNSRSNRIVDPINLLAHQFNYLSKPYQTHLPFKSTVTSTSAVTAKHKLHQINLTTPNTNCHCHHQYKEPKEVSIDKL